MNRAMQTPVYIVLALAATPAVTPASEPTGVTLTVPGTRHSIDMRPMPDSKAMVSAHEVSWDLYDTLVYRLDEGADEPEGNGVVTRPTKPYLMADRGWGHAGFPAISVSHRGAEAFCKWLSAKTGRAWRLPTVAEWTALCASSGITPRTVESYAWCKSNSKRKTHSLGSRQPDANGLYDLHGNVSEWCTTDGGGFVLMGGSFKDHIDATPCGIRKEPIPEWNDTDPQIPKSVWWLSDAPFAGFRVVCDPPSTPTAAQEEEKNE